MKAIHDKGKPWETVGRKTKGPKKAASYRKISFFLCKKRSKKTKKRKETKRNKTIHDKGKPQGTVGRKAIGPDEAASYRKTSFLCFINKHKNPVLRESP